ncbi:MAG: TatD family hydrolase [Candidatus Micrarchaeota archaeon]|nr:TatD family hydrolase [Candidatus Micrarchaeota archaeon]
MIDAHCHLMDMENAGFGVLSPLEAAVNSGYDAYSSRKAIEMKKGKAAGNVKLYSTVGAGPQKCMGPSALQIVDEITSICEENVQEADAIGEIGLDYHWGDTEEKRRMQRAAFSALIALAKELQKPVVIHSRQATAECIRMLDETKFGYGVMFHFFSGSLQEAMEIADRGWLISLPPLRGGKMGVAKAIELDFLAAETDAPYVGKTPLDVKKSIQMIADAKGIGFEEVEKKTSSNTKKLLG